MPQAARLLNLAERLQVRAQPPRPPELRPLTIGPHRVGWVSPTVADFLCAEAPGFVGDAQELRLVDDGLDTRSRSALLFEAALRLRDAGLVRGWRDEALAIRKSPGEALLATIERAACRALGITTEAVHLNAFADDGTLVVARRSPDKAIEPGLWDNLVGGMVPANEILEQALEREAWEEAGLELDRLEVHRGRSFHVRRPVPEGYQSEWIHVYETTLPSDTQCANQDGEVASIEHRPLGDVVDAIEGSEFTLEAALVTLESLTRRGGIGTPPGLYE
jgi:8-oxo-dGTP pyrophosphatase MutT (NUDIX family)